MLWGMAMSAMNRDAPSIIRILLFLYSVPSTLQTTLFHGLISFFILLKLKKKGNMYETNTLRFSSLHVLDTIKSALFVAYISGTIFRVSDDLALA
jgi:hypothetical protein